MSESIVHKPLEDGITHINIFTRGRTRLGRLLTNLADLPVDHPTHGRFRTAEGLWYYLKTGCKHESLRAMTGFDAKKAGRELEVVWHKTFREEFLLGVRAKILGNEELTELLRHSTLPFAHYYYYGSPVGEVPPKMVYPRDSDWQMEFFEALRQELNV